MIFIDKVVRQLSKQMSTEYISGYLLLERAFSVQKKKKNSETKSLRNMLELNVYVQAKKSKKKTLPQAVTAINCDINNLC